MLHKTEDFSLSKFSHSPSGCVVREYIKCGKRNCHCASGTTHGPYNYLLWRERGRLRKRYLRPEEALPYLSSNKALRTSQKSLNPHLMELGYYLHKGEIRASRKMREIEREERRWDLFKEAIKDQFGFCITKGQYLSIVKAVISERKRSNRLGLPWGPDLIVEGNLPPEVENSEK